MEKNSSNEQAGKEELSNGVIYLEAQYVEDPPEPPTKKLIGMLDKCTSDCVEGYVAINYGLRILDEYGAVVREDLRDLKGKVAVVGGAPAGHEPYAIGFVGKGMLAGAVAGGVFVSAGAFRAEKLLRHIHSAQPAGILVIVANSAGQKISLTHSKDILQKEGVKIELFVCGDDSTNTKTRVASRRGLVGTLYMMKIAGAMAEEGRPMKAIISELEVIGNMLGTIGMNLTQCSFPGRPPSYAIPEKRIEMGAGLHGEPGIRSLPLVNVQHAVGTLLTHMIDYRNLAGLHLQRGDEVALIVNNLGVMTYLEELIVCRQAIVDLEKAGVKVLRAYHGRLITSLDMSGVCLAFMRLSPTHGRKERWLQYLDAPTDAPAWPGVVMSETSPDRFTPARVELPDSSSLPDEMKHDVFVIQLDTRGMAIFTEILKAIYSAIHKREAYLNQMDGVYDNGDCGSALTSGIRAILIAWEQGRLEFRYPRSALSDMSDIWASNTEGKSGALYGLFLSAGARAIHEYEKVLLDEKSSGSKSSAHPKAHDHLKMWVDAFESGVHSIVTYGGARLGERTMLDALVPALKVFKRWSGEFSAVKHVLAKAATAAQQGAAKTARMGKSGLSAYAGQARLVHSDPGALGVSIWLQAIAETVAVSFAGPTATQPAVELESLGDLIDDHDK